MAGEMVGVGCRAQRITLVEFVLDTCANVFSQGPCTASGEPCYNTWNTCKDKCNFACDTTSYWFSNCEVPTHLVNLYTPNILSVDSNPTTLELGTSFSTRGRISIVMQDDAHNDQGFDPYWPRGAIPICAEDQAGTLLGRWIERVKYFENRRANVYHGYADQALCDFTKEAYFIDSVSGPSNDCKVTFVLKDPLILADDKNAQCPSGETRIAATQVIGNEYARPFTLAEPLDGVGEDLFPFEKINSYIFETNYLYGDPEQDAFFTRLRHVCVGSEVMEVRAELNNATPIGWNVRLLDRGVCGSAISSHDAGDAVLPAETFENQHVADVVCRLLTECSVIQDIAVTCCDGDADQLINFDSFDKYRCDSALSYICETIICKGVGLTTLLNELSDQFLFFLFFNAETGKIEIANLAPPECDEEVPTLEECQISSFSKKSAGSRYNQIFYRHTATDCSKSLSKDNLSDQTIVVNSDSLREPCERREFKTKKIKEINSRWINDCNSFLAQANGERWLMLRNCPPQQVSANVSLDYAKCFEFGKYAKIHHSKLQSVSGGYLDDYWLLKGKSNDGGTTQLTFERTGFDGTMAPCLNCDTDCTTTVTTIDECGPDSCTGVW